MPEISRRTALARGGQAVAAAALVLVASATPAGAGNTVSEAGKFVERLGEKAIAQLTPKDISAELRLPATEDRAPRRGDDDGTPRQGDPLEAY